MGYTPATAFYSIKNRRAEGETFVTRKITRGLARIKLGLQEKLYLGNLDSLKDWGHARDFVEMQWRMLQQDKPEDFVTATGRQHSVREFVTVAAKKLGMELSWVGIGTEERAVDQNGATVVVVDPRYFRPSEVETLLGDLSYAHARLGWKPAATFEELVEEMVGADLIAAKRDQLVKNHGYNAYEYHE
jgi:GDPmannose 4,6-dehydratase